MALTIPYAPAMVLESFGSPAGVVQSQFTGQLCLDRTLGTPRIYQATSPNGTTWVLQSSGGAGGIVDTIVAGQGIDVDSTDPANPIVSNIGILSVVAGTNITVDDTDPYNPVINGAGGGGGYDSLTGAGESATPGALTQAGGFTVDDELGNGIVLGTCGGMMLSVPTNAGLNINGYGTGAITIGGYNSDFAYNDPDNNPYSFPITVVMGTNDQFVYTPIGTGIPVVYTLAPGVLSSISDLTNAMNTATAPDTTPFSDIGTVQSSFGQIFIDGLSAGDTLTSGVNDALIPVLSFDSPTTALASQTDRISFFGVATPVVRQSVTGALSTVADAAAQAVLTSIIAALASASGYGLVIDATT